MKSKEHGFTLIELMIVVAIIGILAAIAIPNFMRFQCKAKSKEGAMIVTGIHAVEMGYFAENNVYVTPRLAGYAPASKPKYFTTYNFGKTSVSYSAKTSAPLQATAVNDVWMSTNVNRSVHTTSMDGCW